MKITAVIQKVMALMTGCLRFWYLSRTPRTLSVENFVTCEDILDVEKLQISCMDVSLQAWLSRVLHNDPQQENAEMKIIQELSQSASSTWKLVEVKIWPKSVTRTSDPIILIISVICWMIISILTLKILFINVVIIIINPVGQKIQDLSLYWKRQIFEHCWNFSRIVSQINEINKICKINKFSMLILLC